MKKPQIILAGVVLVLGFNFILHAQETAMPVQGGSVSTVDWNSASDLQVMLSALEQVEPVPADAITNEPGMGVAYWSAQHAPGTEIPWPPLPSPTMLSHSFSVWPLGGNQYLLDDVGYDYNAPRRQRAGIQATLSLSSGGVMAMDDDSGPGVPGGGGTNSGGGGVIFGSPQFDTNGLWLQITNVANGLVYLNLMNATDTVYKIISKPDIRVAGNWNIEGELFPGSNTNVLPFTVPESSPTNLFIWAMDWTGVTDSGNTTPEWWFWEFYGTTNLSDTNLDAEGNTLLSDYTNGLDPNVVQFTAGVTNFYVHSQFVPVTLNVTAGEPYYYAVLVNDANQADASWQPYTSSNITVTLGSTDGIYNVSIGLKGLPANATQTWQTSELPLTLDTTPPVLTITNPVLAGGTVTVIQPWLQLQGYANEQLSGLSYDISNATGLFTNQPGNVTDQYFDTNKFDFTTNWFQCYDVPLTNGVNNITLRASDRAGNVAVTNFSVTLDYSGATNPVVQLTWPVNGMQLCQGSFTLRGWVDDSAAAVSAVITDTNGDTNVVMGEVERTGVLWVENLPLAEGTNWLTLMVTNAAGLPSVTNITVVKSDMTLALTSIDGDLWQPTVNVGGVVSDPAATVYVNDIEADVDDYGNWEANNVPVSSSGMASFDMSATPGGGGDPDASTNVEKNAEVVIMSYSEKRTSDNTDQLGTMNRQTKSRDYSANYGVAGTLPAYQGRTLQYVTNALHMFDSDYNTWSWGDGWSEDDFYWSPTNLDEYYSNMVGDDYTNTSFEYDMGYVTCVPDVDLSGAATGGGMAIGVYHYYAKGVNYRWAHPDGSNGGASVEAQTKMKLFTGGKAGSGRMNLIQLQCMGQGYGQPPPDIQGTAPWMASPVTDITSSLQALRKNVGSDGNLWVVEPDNAALDLNLTAPGGFQHYGAWVTPTKYELTLTANGITLSNDVVATGASFCVGQNVPFALSGLPSGVVATNFQWTLGGIYFNAQSNAVPGVQWPTCSTVPYVDTNLLASNTTTAWWVSGGAGPDTDPNIPAIYSASVSCTLIFANGNPSVNINASGLFNMFRPQAKITPATSSVSVYFLKGHLQLVFSSDTNHNGITFYYTLNCPSNFPGSPKWVQVDSAPFGLFQDTNSASHVSVENVIPGPYLDTSFPYGYYDATGTNAVDSPGLILDTVDQNKYVKAEEGDSMGMWMLFKANSGDCLVPLRVVNWSWSGSATNGPSGWQLETGNPANSPSDSDTETYPLWRSNVTDDQWIPSL